MQYKDFRDFPPSLIALKKKGGQYQKAGEAVEALRGRINAVVRGETTDDPFHGMRYTKHGESRIRSAVKYDLSQFARLVTLQSDGWCILLFVGSHDDAERWLDQNKGLQLLVDRSNRLQVTYSSENETGEIASATRGVYSRPLYHLLAADVFDELTEGITRSTVRQIEGFYASTQESELKQVLGALSDDRQRKLLLDVFRLLSADKVQEAVTRISQHKAKVLGIESIAPDALPSLIDGDILRSYSTDDPIFATLLRRFANESVYRDWMLFMHPDQEDVVNQDFDGPAKLVGVSGSGKTCVVVRRAIRLAMKYPGERVLIVTLNRALATLIDELATACAPPEIRERIDVRSFFVLCQDLLRQVNPAQALHIEEYSAEREHVDEIWQEYYRCEHNNHDAAVLHDVHDSLLARGCSAERYLREEMDWIRSALTPVRRGDYETGQRRGRRYGIPVQYRRAILRALDGWEEKMRVVGLIDTLGIAQMLSLELGYIPQPYRCVLVDEVQDFGNVELEIIHALIRSGENNLFLTGDAAQAVTAKYQRIAELGISIPASRTRKLVKNYRNSADVLEAAYSVLQSNLSEEMIENENLDILDPEASSFRGTTPLLLQAESMRQEVRYAMTLAKEKVASHPNAKVCITFCGYSLEEIRRFGEKHELSVLDGRRNLGDDSIFLSDLANTKGFEFDLVVILNCADGVLPDGRLPQEERWREIAMLYVAMTRAKMDLVISWSGTRTSVFDGSADRFLEDSWASYIVDQETLSDMPLPERMEQYRVEAVHRPWREMSGAQFLYSQHAIGLNPRLVEKIRELVVGPGLRRQGELIRWPTMGRAVDACRSSPRARLLWGPETGLLLLQLADRLEHLT